MRSANVFFKTVNSMKIGGRILGATAVTLALALATQWVVSEELNCRETLRAWDVGPMQVPGKYRIGISNTGATATNAFKIQGRNLESGTFKDIVSTSTQFTTIPSSVNGFLLASDDTIIPTALTAGQEWFGAIDTFAYSEVRAISTVATGTTTLSVRVD